MSILLTSFKLNLSSLQINALDLPRLTQLHKRRLTSDAVLMLLLEVDQRRTKTDPTNCHRKVKTGGAAEKKAHRS